MLGCQLCHLHSRLRDFGTGAELHKSAPLRLQKRLDASPDLVADRQLRLLFRLELPCLDLNCASTAALIASNYVEEFEWIFVPTRGHLEVLQPFVMVHPRISDALHDFHCRSRQVVCGEGAPVDLELALGDEIFEAEGLHADG